MKNTDLLILDCDGVLARSEEANIAYYNDIFDRFDLPLVKEGDEGKRNQLHTLSTPQVIEAFIPEPLKAEATAYSNSLDYLEFAAFLTPEPGWAETLSHLKGCLKVCVATNRGRSAPQVIEKIGLSEHIERIFTVNDVKNPKPAPDLLLLASSHFRVPVEKAVYVGDSALDRQAAKAAGMTFIGFRTEGDKRIEDPGELLKLC
jgi:HAD superfamily hydrolase (TIGR01509 family)